MLPPPHTHRVIQTGEAALTKSLYRCPFLLPLTKSNPQKTNTHLSWYGNFTHWKDLVSKLIKRLSDWQVVSNDSLRNEPHLPLFLTLDNHLPLNLDSPWDSLTANRIRQNWPCRALKDRLGKALWPWPWSPGALTLRGNEPPYEVWPPRDHHALKKPKVATCWGCWEMLKPSWAVPAWEPSDASSLSHPLTATTWGTSTSRSCPAESINPQNFERSQ